VILRAKHNFLVYPFFKRYAVWIIKRHFKEIRVIGDYTINERSLLLISNHISWWDGFWAMFLNVKIFKKKFHFMMLEEQLRKYWFFNYTGGFSVSKRSKSIVETLNYTSDLLNDNRNMVLIFPQGEIQTMHNQKFEFEKGLERILKNKENSIQIIFLASLVDFFSNSKPSIYLYLSEFNVIVLSVESIQSKYNEFYSQCVEKQMKLIVEE